MELPRKVILLKKPGEEADLEISTLNKIYPAMDSQLQPAEVEAETELYEVIFLSLI